jgi:hypothetical protein
MDPSSKEDENPNDGKLIGQKWDHHLAKKRKKILDPFLPWL